MATKLFKGAASQYIDDTGKTRMLNFKGLSLMVSPIPPLELVVEELAVIESTLDRALDFIKSRGLTITSQDGDEQDKKIQGLWVETSSEGSTSGIYYGYIPILPSNALPNVDFVISTKNDPLRTDSTSLLENFKLARKVADFLKIYTLYTYALDPESFGDGSKAYVIKPDHIYDIEKLQKRLFKKDNDVMYHKDKLVVLNEEIKTNLMAYLKVSILNDRPGVLALASTTTTDVYYQSVSDFKPSPNQLIFTSKAAVLRWKREIEKTKDNLIVSQILQKSKQDPYFYRNPNLKRNQLVIIQNVNGGTLEKAISVSDKWIKDRVNPGFSTEDLSADTLSKVKKESLVTYAEGGEISKTGGKIKNRHSVILYDDGSYAAVLFLAK